MLEIIYETEHMLVVNKPAGVAVHPDRHHPSGTLLDEIREKYPTAELAHRLDKDTSGLLMVGKTPQDTERLKDLFRTRDITKTYKALVVGRVAKDEGVITLNIGRSTSDPRKRVAMPYPQEGTRAAETAFRVLERFGNYTLLEVTPKTGRTHQIRSHLSSIGHPVACDNLYGGKRYICPAGLTRQFLHAYALEFTGPDGGRVRLEAEMPHDLKKILETFNPQPS